MRIKETKVYKYKELSDKAKAKAIDWFRQGYPDYDWWDYLYEDFDKRAQELGIEITRKPVPLMNGKTRQEPEIYFSGFHHQGSGSSFTGRWRAWCMNPEKLRSECPTDTELHRICDVLRDCAIEDGEMWANIGANGDNWINVEVADGETTTETLDNLEYKSSEYNTLAQTCEQRANSVTDTLRDFNRWIYAQLETEYEYITSDQYVEDAIISNEYEFTEDGDTA